MRASSSRPPGAGAGRVSGMDDQVNGGLPRAMSGNGSCSGMAGSPMWGVPTTQYRRPVARGGEVGGQAAPSGPKER
jgi:hypothetical protein